MHITAGKNFAGRITTHWVVIFVLIMLMGISMRWAIIHHDYKSGSWGDEGQYEGIGRNIAEGHGFTLYGHPTALRVPVTPYMLAAIYSFGEHDLAKARMVWSVIDTVFTCLLILYLTTLIGGSRLASLIAAAGFGLNPYFAFIGSHVLSETPFTILFVAALVLLIKHWYTKSWWSLCLSGVVLALSTLARPTGFLFPAVVVLLLFLEGRQRKSPWLARSVVYVFMVGLTMAPWVIRNAIVFKTFVPLNTFGGATLWCGSGAMPGGDLVIGPWCDAKTKATMDTMNEVDADRYLKQEAMSAIQKNPAHWMHLGLIKFVRLWFRVPKPGWTSVSGLFLAFINAAILILTWQCVRRPEYTLLRYIVVAVFIYYSVLHVITYAELRYSIPAYAFYLPFAVIKLTGRLGGSPVSTIGP